MSRAADDAHAARLTVDLAAVADNWRALDARTPPGCETGAAVKADGYGLGATRVSRALATAGCQTFFVATLSEARALAEALSAPTIRLFVMNGFRPEAAAEDPRLLPVISDAAAWAAWRGADRPCGVALQLETGMNRLGLTADELARAVASGTGRLRIDLVMSHLATSDAPEHPLAIRQKTAFDGFQDGVARLAPNAQRSLAATGGILLGDGFAYDLTRPGVGLYGGLPFVGARPVAFVDAPILRVWDVASGETSGYGADWVARRPSRLATIPIGYADGFPRSLGDKGVARIGGREVPFAGRVSMDLIVLDVTDIDPSPRPGDRAALLDESLTIDRVAQAARTIGYEILTGLGGLGARGVTVYTDRGG